MCFYIGRCTLEYKVFGVGCLGWAFQPSVIRSEVALTHIALSTWVTLRKPLQDHCDRINDQFRVRSQFAKNILTLAFPYEFFYSLDR